jgi:CRP-like cAMP-binding protein
LTDSLHCLGGQLSGANATTQTSAVRIPSVPLGVNTQSLSFSLNLKKGEFLFRQGASVDRLFFLEKGRVKLVRNTIEGQPLVIHIAYSQEFFKLSV